jgi:hypothetical protein
VVSGTTDTVDLQRFLVARGMVVEPTSYGSPVTAIGYPTGEDRCSIPLSSMSNAIHESHPT